MTETGPPAKRARPTAAPPDFLKEIARLDARFKGMWEKYIEPMSKTLVAMGEQEQGDVAPVLEQVAELSKSLTQTRMLLAASLYDPVEMALLAGQMSAASETIRLYPGELKPIAKKLHELREKKLDLDAQAEDIIRPLRVEVRNATFVNDADKVKNTYPNDPSRDDALTDALAASEDFQAIAASLGKVRLDTALAKLDLSDLEENRRAASKLLHSQGLRLANLTARLLNPTPLGEKDHD